MNLKYIVFILLSIANFYKTILCQKCPLLQTYHNPVVNLGFVVRNFLRIPKTNILVINTLYNDLQDSNIVYFNDLSSSSGEIINVVKPNYVIIDMQYNIYLELIMVTNYYSLVFADPYTLKAVYSVPIPQLQGLFLIEETNYIILTRFYNQLQIYDFMQQKPVLTMDNSKTLEKSPDGSKAYQYQSKIYTLKNGQKIILTTNDMGVIYWIIDVENLTYQFIGYIEQSKVKKQGDKFRQFQKHPTKDIFFFGGQNLEIIVVKLIDIQTNQFQTLDTMSLYDNQYTDPITNLYYTLVLGDNGQLNPILWAGDNYYVYSITLNESADDSSLKLGGFESYAVDTMYRWYVINETSMIYISSGDFVTIFNYQTNEFTKNLYFYGDLFCRRYMRQVEGSQDQYILLSGNQLLLYDKGNFGSPSLSQKSQFDENVRWRYGSFYQIKNQFDYYFVKVGADDENSKIYVFPIYPLGERGSVVDITDLYGLEWININSYLDPFYLGDTYWVAFAFPQKQNTEDYLFMLIDCTSSNERSYYLKSNKTSDSSIQTAFAVASLDNPNNLELIGVDNYGTIYAWDLGQDGFPFKFYINFSICQKSQIGDIFYFNETVSRLIISCSNSNVYSIDYTTGKFQNLVQLSQQPAALKAFSNHQLVAIGDFNTGVAYIFKFNPQTSNFDLFLNVQSSKIQDQIIHIEILKDNTIWVQFTFSNLFYSLNDCLEDSSLCTQCNQEYYFEASEQYDSNGVYGVGSVDYPFTTSNNFLTAMIKAQYYKQIVSGVSNMFVDILVKPHSILGLNPKFMNFDFNSIISLNFKSSIPGQYATLQYQNLLEFQNYNQVGFQDIIIYFGLDNENSNCGLYFANIENNVYINNIQLYLYTQTSAPKSCQSIYSDSSILNVFNYSISNEDFSNHKSILTYFNVTNINFNNFSLTDCILGDSFSILTQESDLKVLASNITLSNNICSSNSDDPDNDEKISALFSSGNFNVNNMTVNNNTFCKKIIFSCVSSLDQTNQVFSFQDLNVYDNYFQAKTEYLFFDALYSMRVNPNHELHLDVIQFKNNSLLTKNNNDLIGASYFQTMKIATISASNTMLINHFDIKLGLFQNANNFTISFNALMTMITQLKYLISRQTDVSS
ncbi:hypothetical protein TTHERM_000630609 (macronuclear) [Tetrahymena thermophila SB210]|uniref:Transmembrane protein n=1 Tax=Tetrahymena thermophila (strain SB210) TaxID=312017 RepID=W7X0C1_TETTS|nr:hypothetical protein TTHERM_000630609 [Tetrahymena thermophila SB210]EWS72560.1 hypothetical protein TTHERM_000630609 [Tetrahymena thermophila SB210]|eukprot:XP_012654843.1 hypothetical protein TTHERM_000630609 [Tetrahymena thermophila SB210]